MARVTNLRADARREQVAELWVQGVHLTGIAARLGLDWRTARRDVAVIGRRLVAETDVPVQLHRLLKAAQAVEASGWEAQQLGIVLASVKTQLAVLQVLQGLDVVERLERVEAQLATLGGVGPGPGYFGVPGTNGRHAPE